MRMKYLAMIAQEDGFIPGPGLSTLETVTRYVVAPTILFVVIAGITFALTAPRKKESASVITHIE